MQRLEIETWEAPQLRDESGRFCSPLRNIIKVETFCHATSGPSLQVLGDTFEGEQVEKLLSEADILKENMPVQLIQSPVSDAKKCKGAHRLRRTIG